MINPAVANISISAPKNGMRMADTNKTLQHLLQIKNSLLMQLKEVDQLINQIQGVQSQLKRFSLKSAAEIGEYPPGSSRSRGYVSPSQIADKAEAILRENGLPMTRSVLARELINAGMPLQGGDVNKNVGTILWRHRERFVNLKKLGYWLKDVEIPGVYSPTDYDGRVD